jgi:dienelactone hydrolase
MTLRRLLLVSLALWLAAAIPVQARLSPGWQRIDLPAAGTYYWRYVPASLDAAHPPPLVVFFHGAGGNPDVYLNYVREAAEAAGCVLALPKSLGSSWTPGLDEAPVAAVIADVEAALPIDGRRIALAGHSAGGAYAYLLAYASNPSYSAVFTLGASFYPVSRVVDPGYKAPIRMYYGTGDLNYLAGPYNSLRQQWDRLGIAHEEDVRAGYDHNTWPVATMIDGFRFLVGKTYAAAPPSCIPSATRVCLQGGRFAVDVTWQTAAGTGSATAIPAVAADSAVFWFFAPDNWELLVKVIDGCGVNGRYWVFEAAMTDVQYTVTVTDTWSGTTVRQQNPGGRTAQPILDTAAFAGCPP